jgi:serine/threonine-protein kinase PknG
MNGDACRQQGCSGSIEDGYCNACGHAEPKAAGTSPTARATSATSSFSSAVTTGTGSSPISRTSQGVRRTSHSSSRTTRKQLGAGLISIPDLPSTDPERAIMLDPKVPERKRFCASCDAPLKREAGFCGKCGMKYNFVPSLKAKDVVAGQYELKGPIAFGGLGWIYLAFDKVLSRYVVLKGLLNTQDESAAAVAVAERQFLAAVKHPNIVGIYNFVQNGSEGFIVMEYVGGKTLKQIRRERGPLPAAEAVAYIHRILPAFAYLHRAGLVYCDFKPDNVMMEKDDVKLIDMGGVRRIDDKRGDIYGTVGYSAPEAGSGPTPGSDLFTIGRTLAVLLTDIPGFATDHIYTLPSPKEEPLLAQQESLYRFLLKATAHGADDRFETAEEMAEQLLGVLREVVAVKMGTPRPAESLFFSADLLTLEGGEEMEPIQPDYRYLPLPTLDMEDPAARAVSHATALTDGKKRVAALRIATQQTPKSREARLRLAAALLDIGVYPEAGEMLKALGEEDHWDWRVLWFQGLMQLAGRAFAGARKSFDQVYFDLPGEVAPKLSLGLACELADERDVAIEMYDLVSRTDPGFVSAIFGLARCLHAKGRRRDAVAALDRIPQSSALYLRGRIEAARILIRQDHSAPNIDELAAASTVAESLSLEGMSKLTLASQILYAALNLLHTRAVKENETVRILGNPLLETRLRAGLESTLRSMARFATGEERIRLVDQANLVRPRTLV